MYILVMKESIVIFHIYHADIALKIRRNELEISHIISHNTITHLLRLRHLNQQILSGQTTANVTWTTIAENY